MQQDLFDRTYRISELGEELRLVLRETFGEVWVVGEIQRLKESHRGHLYFELVEKGEEDEIVGRIDAVLWRSKAQKVTRELRRSGQSLTEGVEIRCRGRVDFYPPGGRLQLAVEDVDPVFSLGLLAQRRQETLQALTAGGLIDRNRDLPLSLVPLRVGLVTSHDSAAYHDFVTTLAGSGYGFRVLLVHAAVQGAGAEGEIVAALRTIGGLEVDVVALIRGGGSRSDLAVFDTLAVATAVANTPQPVVTGLGHEIDEAVADLVCHTALKTPTMAADFLVRRVEETDARLARVGAGVGAAAHELLGHRREQMARAKVGVERVRRRLERERARIIRVAGLLSRFGRRPLRRERARLDGLVPMLRASGPSRVDRERRRRLELGRRLTTWSLQRVARLDERCDGLERLCRELSPERTLERGFSITRTGEGAVVRGDEELERGQVLVTELARGIIRSRVEEQ